MRLPSVPRVSALFSALRDPRRLRRWAVELLVLLALFAAVSLWQNRDLPSGPAPSLAGMRNDGVAENLATKVGAGEAAVLVVVTGCVTVRLALRVLTFTAPVESMPL